MKENLYGMEIGDGIEDSTGELQEDRTKWPQIIGDYYEGIFQTDRKEEEDKQTYY